LKKEAIYIFRAEEEQTYLLPGNITKSLNTAVISSNTRKMLTVSATRYVNIWEKLEIRTKFWSGNTEKKWPHETVKAKIQVLTEFVDKVALGRFAPSTSVSPANCHSTNVPCSSLIQGWNNGPTSGQSGLSPTP
jgi:hypothetical protein